MKPTGTSVLDAAVIAARAKDGKPQIVGDTSRALKVLRANAERWGLAIKPYNASSYEVSAK